MIGLLMLLNHLIVNKIKCMGFIKVVRKIRLKLVRGQSKLTTMYLFFLMKMSYYHTTQQDKTANIDSY